MLSANAASYFGQVDPQQVRNCAELRGQVVTLRSFSCRGGDFDPIVHKLYIQQGSFTILFICLVC